MSKGIILIHTDGSCDNKTGIGGFGIVLRSGKHKKEYFEGQYVETNSARMELMAVIRALELCNQGWEIVIHTDNQYVQKTVELGWLTNWMNKGILEDKKNPDLWRKFKKIYDELGGKNYVTIKWVRGHNGNKYNEIADKLANHGRKLKEVIVDIRH